MPSLAHFEAIAASLSPPETRAFIGGQFVDAVEGATFESMNPATGKSLAHIAACGEQDVDKAVTAARTSFRAGLWSALHPGERKVILQKFADLIEEQAEQLAVLESLDSGKPIADCTGIDVPELCHCIRWYAEATDKLYDQLSPSGHKAVGMIKREAIGVVGTVLPWNFPLMMLGWKIAPALAAGNSMVIKPAEETSLSTLYVAKLAQDAGIPDGVFNVVTGLGQHAGQAMGLHNDIDVISFTGSTEVGRLFLKYAADSNLKRIVLECGGKNPSVVLEDAGDLDAVAEQVTGAVFWNMGENCTSNSRLIVHEKHKDSLLNKILNKTGEWKTGNPLDPHHQLGAMISKTHFDKVAGYIETGKAEGAKIVLGGQVDDKAGLFIQPTVFDKVTPNMTIAKEEIFGPVLSIITAPSDEEAISVANESCYGLQASLFSRDISKAHIAAQKLHAGTVTVNCYGEGDITTPFGGYKLSGFGGKDNGMQAFDQYTETKTIWIDLST